MHWVSVSIQCFDWSEVAAKLLPAARTDEYAKPCEPAIHVLRSVGEVTGISDDSGWLLMVADIILVD